MFVLWGTAEMSDLVRGALISIPKHQYESSAALGLTKSADLSLRDHSAGRQETDPAVHQPDHTNDQDDQPDLNDRCCRGVEGGTADYRGKPDVQPECSVWNLSDRIFIVFSRMLANQYACKISGKEMEVIFLGTDIVIYRTFVKKVMMITVILDDINLDSTSGRGHRPCRSERLWKKYDASMYQRSGTHSGRRDQTKW